MYAIFVDRCNNSLFFQEEDDEVADCLNNSTIIAENRY